MEITVSSTLQSPRLRMCKIEELIEAVILYVMRPKSTSLEGENRSCSCLENIETVSPLSHQFSEEFPDVI
jgi:hypothetical protein